MIPRIIHFCWFGNNPLPDLAIRCIESWKKYCPDYEIKLWNESNFDLKCCPYVTEAYNEKQWAFVSDYARLKIIYENGGIYLDTDVEILKPFDPLLGHGCFLGTERDQKGGWIATGLGFGAEKGHPIVKLLLNEYNGAHFCWSNGVYDTTTCPIRNTRALLRIGFLYSNVQIWKKDNLAVYPPEYFCPLDFLTRETHVTENSYSIHHYAALWITKYDRDRSIKFREIDEHYGLVVRTLKKQWILFQMAKSEGKTNSFLLYLWSKLKLKRRNRLI